MTPSQGPRLFLLCCSLVAACAGLPGDPALRGVEPAVLDSVAGGSIELRGAGFLPTGTYDFDHPATSVLNTAVRAALTLGQARAELLEVTLLDSARVSAVVPPGLTEGVWTVHLFTPRGAELVLPEALRLQVNGAGPDAGEGAGQDAGENAGQDAGQDAGDDAGQVAGEDAGFDAGPLPCATLTLLDDDGDGFGAPDSGALLCGPSRVLLGGDCNDLDLLTSPAGVERCNALDDDCDGVTDEGCADGGFVRVGDGGVVDLVGASAWAPNRLWVVGATKLLVIDGDAGVIDASRNCPTNMNAVWAMPSGRAFVAGGNNGVGRLAIATRGGGCASSELIPEPVAGMVGFAMVDGGARVEAALRDGRRASWDGVNPPRVSGASLPSGFVLHDAHGSSPDVMFAVGGSTANPRRPAVFQLLPDGGLSAESLPTQNVQAGQLHGVWVLSKDEVVAVGDNGLVLRKVRGAWERIAPPSMADYTTVRAFSIGRFSLSTEFGYLRQWSGQWSLRYTDQVAVRDLTAFDEEHFWLVGDNEVIISGPVTR